MRGLRGPSSPIFKKENIMTLTAKEFSVPPEIFKSAPDHGDRAPRAFHAAFQLARPQRPRRNRPWLWTVSPSLAGSHGTLNIGAASGQVAAAPGTLTTPS